MPRYVLQHQHQPRECGVAFAAWRGTSSPLRRHPAVSSCISGGHAIWWTVEAPDQRAALDLLPEWVAHRTQVSEVREVPIP